MKLKIIFFFIAILVFSACKNKKQTALISINNALHYTNINKPDSALIYYHKALSDLETTNSDSLKALIYNNIGYLCFLNDVDIRAENAYDQALIYALRLKEQTQISIAYRGKGKCAYVLADYKTAQMYFQNAQQLNPKLVDLEERASVYNNLSNVTYRLLDYPLALLYNLIAINTTNDSIKKYRNYALRGKLFGIQQIYDSAYFYLTKAVNSSDLRTLASCYYKLSNMPYESGITDSLKFYYITKAQETEALIKNQNKSIKITEIEYLQTVVKKSKLRTHTKIIAIILFSTFILSLIYLLFYYRKKHVKLATNMSAYYEKEEVLHNKEQQLMIVLNQMGSEAITDFKKNSYYVDLLTKLNKGKTTLNYKESEELQVNIENYFKGYLLQLKGLTQLTTNDKILCCLSLTDLTTKEIAACRSVSVETIRSQRTRLKKKMYTNSLSKKVFDYIFAGNK